LLSVFETTAASISPVCTADKQIYCFLFFPSSGLRADPLHVLYARVSPTHPIVQMLVARGGTRYAEIVCAATRTI
jgi:hypothetical protein